MLGTLERLDAAQEAPASFEAAREFFDKHLRATVVTTKIGKVHIIGASWREMKRGMKTDALKCALLPHVPEILQGTYMGREAAGKGRTDYIAFHFFQAAVKVEGRRVTAGVTVGERADKTYEFVAYGLNHSGHPSWKKKEASGSAGNEPASDASDVASKLDNAMNMPAPAGPVNEGANGLNISILHVLDEAGGLPTLERLSKATALRDVTLNEGATTEGDVKRRIALHLRAASLRAVLLGKAAPASLGNLDLFDAAGSVAVLDERLSAVKAAGDAVDVANTSAYVRILAGRMHQLARLMGDQDAEQSAANLVRAAPAYYVTQMERDHQTAMTDRYLANPGAQMVQAAVDEANHGLSPEEVQRAAVVLKLNAERERLERAYSENRRAIRDTRDRLRAEYEAGRLPMKDYLGGIRIMDERSVAIVNDINATLRRTFGSEALDPLGEAKADPIKTVAQALIDRMAEASPVSAQQATDWAAKQEVTASAKNALKKIGYAPEALRADVAQFYRLTGGRLASVRIKASAGRASASEIHGHKNRTINMGAGFCKRTLFHELGHHLEADPQVFAAARGFLLKRRESDKVYTLRALTGNSGYGAKEVAYKDSWTNPYVGKHYSYDVTEVISMGMEAFSSDEAMAQVVREDPEHVKLIAGFLTATQDPLFAAVKQVFAQQADAEEDIAEESGKVIERGLKDLAAGIEFTKLEKPPEYYVPGMGYIGTWQSGEAMVSMFDGKVRDPVTKRQRKGFKLIGQVKEGQWTSTLSVFSMDEGKAQCRLFAKEGRFMQYLLSSPQEVAKWTAMYGSAAA